MKNQREQFNRLLFWLCWCLLLIVGAILLTPLWKVVFIAIWILFGVFIYWIDTAKEIEDENMEL